MNNGYFTIILSMEHLILSCVAIIWRLAQHLLDSKTISAHLNNELVKIKAHVMPKTYIYKLDLTADL